MSEPRSTPSWFPQIEDTHPVPVARSLEEMAEATFRSQDLMTRQGEEAGKERRRSRAVSHADMVDEAENLAFLGRPVLSAIEYFQLASDAADREEEAERKRGQARQIEAQERRIAELEAEAAMTATRAERASRGLTQANEGWGRARDEAASFRDATYRAAYR
jgi:hypothetical protein